MKQHTLSIKAHDKPTVMEKMLQVSRYRGFAVSSMTMYPSNDENMLDIQLSIRSHHSVDNLLHQLNKIIDIDEVKVDNITAQQCRA